MVLYLRSHHKGLQHQGLQRRLRETDLREMVEGLIAAREEV
jgi:hypothetical protein